MDEQQESQPSPREDGEVGQGNEENEVQREEEEEDRERNLPPTRHLDQTQVRSSGSPHLSFFGKHRMKASIANLSNQIHVIEEELQQLETFGKASAVCGEFISTVELLPDPLLPITKGPVGVSWDRWFTGANHSRSQKRWL